MLSGKVEESVHSTSTVYACLCHSSLKVKLAGLRGADVTRGPWKIELAQGCVTYVNRAWLRSGRELGFALGLMGDVCMLSEHSHTIPLGTHAYVI